MAFVLGGFFALSRQPGVTDPQLIRRYRFAVGTPRTSASEEGGHAAPGEARRGAKLGDFVEMVSQDALERHALTFNGQLGDELLSPGFRIGFHCRELGPQFSSRVQNNLFTYQNNKSR